MTKDKDQWIEGMARAGYLAKGIVYLMVGVIAATAAFEGGSPKGSEGALETVLNQPFGKVLLGLIGVGLLGYAAWKFVQCVKDSERKGSDASGMIQRGGYFLSGLAHTGLAVFCARTALSGSSQGNGGPGAQQATASAMSQPMGQWLVGLVGLVLVGVGLFRLSTAWNQSFKSKFHLNEMSQHEREVAVKAGIFGIAARAVVFALTGFFFLKAAISANPQKAGATQEVLTMVEQQGTWYLAVLALGLVAYAVYQGFLARYRHIKPATG